MPVDSDTTVLPIADVNVTWTDWEELRCRSRRYEREPVLRGFAVARRTSALQPEWEGSQVRLS